MIVVTDRLTVDRLKVPSSKPHALWGFPQPSPSLAKPITAAAPSEFDGRLLAGASLPVAGRFHGPPFTPTILMANAKETSPAENPELRIRKKFFVNDIVLSIGQKNRCTVQRRYTLDDKTGYSEWIRLTDLPDVMHALRCYERWNAEHPYAEADDKAA